MMAGGTQAVRRSPTEEGTVTNDKQKIQFLVHADSDTVGVATVDVRAGETVQGSYLHSQRRIALDALDDIPLGHREFVLTKLYRSA